MIIKSLSLENFGIYNGKHTVDLTVTDDKPIILLGALNGGGKTTFLDALQLVLYGKLARCSNRGHQSYSRFLTNAKNRYSTSDATVCLQLIFSHTTDTDTKEYTVTRSWQVHNKTDVTDKVQVACNGQHDPHLSQNWDEFVNEFIPLSLSDLFFFDGEKIENLADPERSAELIKTGIESLLGLDLLSQLQLDLTNVERKRKSENLDSTVIEKVTKCEADIGELNTTIAALKTEIAALEKEGSDHNIAINKARQKVRNAGAHLIEERDTIKFELGAIKEKTATVQAQLVKLDSGCGPLSLVSDLLAQTKQQAEHEQVINEAKIVDGAIAEYEAAIKQTLAAQNVDSQAMGALSNTMEQLANDRQQLANQECYIGFNPAIFAGIKEQIAQNQAAKAKFTDEKQALIEHQALYQKKIESIPDYETVQHLLADLVTNETKLEGVLTLLKAKQQQLAKEQARYEVESTKYKNLLTKQSKDTFEQKRAIQVGDHITKLKSTMASFALQLVKENIALLEQLILTKFAALMRKDNLVSAVLICPENFNLTLKDAQNEILPPDRLSAGERQLLAIAILWALAEASQKEIPAVIDTPLGRLDGKHRSKLVERYFPHASSQVILLSTDEEINGDYYHAVTPHVNREFKIEFNQQNKTSTIQEGYFGAA